MTQFKVFTAGAVSGNGAAASLGGWSLGGWAAIVYDHDFRHLESLSGSERGTTNISMKLTAVAEVLEHLPVQSRVELHADLEMVARTMSGQWQARTNLDLWQRIREAVDRHASVRFCWIKGHVSRKQAGDNPYLAGNRAADQLAVAARKDGRPRTVEAADLPAAPDPDLVIVPCPVVETSDTPASVSLPTIQLVAQTYIGNPARICLDHAGIEAMIAALMRLADPPASDGVATQEVRATAADGSEYTLTLVRADTAVAWT